MTSQPHGSLVFARLLFGRLRSVFYETTWRAGIFATVTIGTLALYHPSFVQAAEAGQSQGSPTLPTGELLDQQIAEIVQKSDLPGPLAHPTLFKIPIGERLGAIASRLEQEGIISDSRTFLVTAYYSKLQYKIKAGEYTIKAKASVRDVLNAFVQGNPFVFDITILPGLTSRQIVEKLRVSINLVGEIKEIPPEGSLKPGTYRYTQGTTRTELIQRMQK